MAKRLATTGMAMVVFLLALLGVAHATERSSPTVRLDCEHGISGCAGMNGEFNTGDGGPMTSFAVKVVDLTTGAVIDVTATGCQTATRPENPDTALVSCMIDASQLGIDGDIVWSVWVNGVEVWASAPTPTRCEPPEETTTTTTTTTVGPNEEQPTTTVAETTTTTTTVAPQITSTTETPPPGEVTETTAAVLVSGNGPPPSTGTGSGSPGVTVAAQETLPATGISLGALAAIGLTLLGVGVALEGLTRSNFGR